MRLLLFLFVLSGCQSIPLQLELQQSKEDVLYYEAFGADGNGDRDILVVYLPGDTAAKGNRDNRYFFLEARHTANIHDVVAVSILRPGTFDKLGNKSKGFQPKSDDNKTPQNLHYVAETILYLKQQYKAKYIIGVGHSGGAMSFGVLLGKFPGFINSVVLTSSVCDLPKYRIKRRGKNTWPRSESTTAYMSGVESGSHVSLVTGELDPNTLPQYARECAELFHDNGIDADVVVVPGASHDYRTLKETVRKELAKSIANVRN